MADVLIREIAGGDLQNGFLESLDTLRKASGMDRDRAEGILGAILSDANHKIFVAECGGRIVGSTTLIIEQKFIHDGGLAGHIEDVVVTGSMQGRKIGAQLVRHALDYARSRGCYKTILNCADDVSGFYERMGFARNSSEMRYDHR